ncbi:MAG TPA: flagellar hook-length control protein FliK, partial [Anaerolineales bacterium]|nr:flagellar hook-length control protein FliK [Anaerolineales bacterium]HNB35698.1 flagellar hook-length control protein FliK [Anaerolineales bacterium]
TPVVTKELPKAVSADIEMPVVKMATKPVNVAKAEAVELEAVEVKPQSTPVATKELSNVVSVGVEVSGDVEVLSRFEVAGRFEGREDAVVFEQGTAFAEQSAEADSESALVKFDPEKKADVKEVEQESVLDASGVVEQQKGAAEIKKMEKAAMKPLDLGAEVVEQITSQLKPHFKSGETSIRMQLNPQDLGTIEVQMTHNAQGVSVSFITEQSGTGQLLESQAGQLRQSLKDAGVQLANLNINQHHQPSHEGGGFRQSQQFTQTPPRSVLQVEVDEGMQVQRAGSSSEIDYLI